jgi:hypothetical protein
MSEDRLRLASLSVLGSSIHGRRYDPEEVVGEILIGSDDSCHLVVDLPSISPIHAKIWTDLDDCKVKDTSAPRGVYVNTERVAQEARLDEGDVLWLGPPQEAGSVCIKCHFKPWVEVLPGAMAAVAGEVQHGGPGFDELPAPEPSADELVAPAEAAPAPPPPPDPESAFASAPEPSAAPAAGEDDPFFVGEAEASGAVSPSEPAVAEPPVAEAAAFEVPAPADTFEPDAPPAAIFELEAPAGAEPEAVTTAAADEWSISDAPAEPEPAPAPAADEFFVAGEPDEAQAAPEEPTFVVPEPEPEAEAAAAVPFLDLPPLEPSSPPIPTLTPPTPPAATPAPKARPAPAVPVPTPTAAPAAAAPQPAPTPAPVAPGPVAPDTPVAAAAASPQPAAEARPPAATPRPQPARRPAAAALTARRPPAARSASPRAAGGSPTWLKPVGLGAAGLLVVGTLGFGAMKLMGGSVRLDSVQPQRVRVGQRATLSGSGFSSDPAGQTVIFGERQAKVLQASPKRLEVEVPEAVVSAGAESRVPVVVRTKGRSTAVVEVTVFQGPRLHGISPGAAMPGEEVMLAGAGWGVGATVKFGPATAQTLEVQPTQIRALVPEAGTPGTELAVVVTIAGVDSNPAPFILGHLPVVSGVSPASAGPGDVVTVSGKGFETIPARNDVRVGGAPALVVAATGDSLQFVVPRLGAGESTRAVEVRVPGSTSVGQAQLALAPGAAAVDFRFIAEPFVPAPGRVYALLATELGPAFVLAASGGRTAGERAVAAAERLNAAAQPLRTTVGLTLEARGLESNPVIGLVGHPEALLEVSEEDAAAYDEDWTGLRGRGGPVTRARLARWWEALGRDLVLMTIRSQPPTNAAALAPEGRVLAQLFELAQKSGAAGVPRQLVDDARAPVKDGLRLLGLRVPPTVTAAAAAAAAAAGAAPTPAATPPPLQLEGSWGGNQVEQGLRTYLSVTFRGSGGNVAYEGGITFTVPMLTVEKPRRDQVRFSVQIRGGFRHYTGQWDGEAITGNVTTDGAGKNVVGTFELRRR